MAKDNKDVTEAPVNFGANLGLMLDLYDDYLQDPSSVPDDLQVLFRLLKWRSSCRTKSTTEGSGSSEAMVQLSVLCA